MTIKKETALAVLAAAFAMAVAVGSAPAVAKVASSDVSDEVTVSADVIEIDDAAEMVGDGETYPSEAEVAPTDDFALDGALATISETADSASFDEDVDTSEADTGNGIETPIDQPIDYGTVEVGVGNAPDSDFAIVSDDGACISCNTMSPKPGAMAQRTQTQTHDRRDRVASAALTPQRKSGNLCNYATFNVGFICDSWRAAQAN